MFDSSCCHLFQRSQAAKVSGLRERLAVHLRRARPEAEGKIGLGWGPGFGQRKCQHDLFLTF